MPKFNVSVSFSLRTMIEPEGVHFDRDYPEGVEEIEDASYYRSTEIDADGGHVTFTVEAEDEDAAERISEDVVFDGMEVEDDAGFTWVVDDRSVEVERVEIPMTLDRAREILVKLAEGREEEEVEEAVEFVFDHVLALARRLDEATQRVADVEHRLEEALNAVEAARLAPTTEAVTEGS